MQPCAVCGAVVVDAAGYCVQCGTFRGSPPPPLAGPVSTPPGFLSSSSGPPAPGYPAPGYPAPGHPAPGYAAPPPPARPPRNPYVVPLVALSATLVVIVIAIVVVVVSRRGSSGGPPLVDSCVVGRWQVTSHDEQVSLAGVGPVRFTGRGARIEFAKNGTGLIDYGTGTAFTGQAAGKTYVLTLKGTVRMSYRTANGTIAFSDVRPDGTAAVAVDGVPRGEEPLGTSDDPAGYTCVGDTLTEHTDLYRVELARVSN